MNGNKIKCKTRTEICTHYHHREAQSKAGRRQRVGRRNQEEVARSRAGQQVRGSHCKCSVKTGSARHIHDPTSLLGKESGRLVTCSQSKSCQVATGRQRRKGASSGGSERAAGLLPPQPINRLHNKLQLSWITYLNVKMKPGVPQKW